MNLFPLTLYFFLLQTAITIISENLSQLANPKITHLLATHHDTSKQYNLPQFSLIGVQKNTQAPSQTGDTPTFASVFIVAKAKNLKNHAVLQLFKSIEFFVLKVNIPKGTDLSCGLAY